MKCQYRLDKIGLFANAIQYELVRFHYFCFCALFESFVSCESALQSWKKLYLWRAPFNDSPLWTDHNETYRSILFKCVLSNLSKANVPWNNIIVCCVLFPRLEKPKHLLQKKWKKIINECLLVRGYMWENNFSETMNKMALLLSLIHI